VTLLVAQGFRLGRIPFAPGTFGSVLGLVWFGLLLTTQRLSLMLLGTVAGLVLSIWLCGVAEKALGEKDPPSVVLDEITAMPVCFFSWIGIWLAKNGGLPSPAQLLAGNNWLVALGIFIAFRFFDVVKPWPVRQSQVMPRGWGITIDDLLAAVYVNASMLLLHLLGML